MTDWVILPTNPLDEDVPACPQCKVALPRGESVYSTAQVKMRAQGEKCPTDHLSMNMVGTCADCGYSWGYMMFAQATLHQCPKCHLLWRVEPVPPEEGNP